VSVKLKAQARQQKKSALDLREELEAAESKNEDAVALAQKSDISLGTAASVFLITSGIAFTAFTVLNRGK